MPGHPSYIRLRRDLLGLVDGDYSRVLDVGCAEGENGAYLKAQRPGAVAVGIELDATMAQMAAQRLDEVLVGDAAAKLSELSGRADRFDLVVLGDVLEHLVDPWNALRVVRNLCPSGHVLVSLPNVGHYTTILAVAVRGYWPYRDRGIHDRTHLRFFGRSNLPELFEDAGFQLEELRIRYRVREAPSFVNRLVEPVLSRLPIVRRPFAYQFLCRLA
jgi:2-polyprenyl-3-methyl-5-hydroxy-6-metoxy-1,4-benzoquinol methylase